MCHFANAHSSAVINVMWIWNSGSVERGGPQSARVADAAGNVLPRVTRPREAVVDAEGQPDPDNVCLREVQEGRDDRDALSVFDELFAGQVGYSLVSAEELAPTIGIARVIDLADSDAHCIRVGGLGIAVGNGQEDMVASRNPGRRNSGMIVLGWDWSRSGEG